MAEDAIPLSQVGAEATANYQGEALGITPSSTGATLRCGFQKLDGRASEQGLWLASTEPGGSEEFRIVAQAFGRGEMNSLPGTGRVTASDKLVQLVRPGLVEEYSVSADGVRQDFVILLRPDGGGQLRVALDVEGARAEAAELGAKLVLKSSGREIAYSRLHVTDANGKELPSKIHVSSEKQLEITVDDTGAAYPLRIDPTFSDADWVSLNSERFGVNGIAYAVSGDAAGNVYVGGSFTKAGTVDAKNIARWDGTQWWPMGAGLEQSVLVIAVMNGEILAAGSTPTVMRWNGTTWQPLGNGVTGVRLLAVKGADLYAAGSFLTADGITVNRIARWNGTAWSALGSGVNGVIHAMTVSDAGVQVAGEFTSADGVSVERVAQWNGSGWEALGIGLFATPRTLVWHQGALWAGGDAGVGLFNGSSVARWDGGELWEDQPAWGHEPVWCLASDGQDLYAGTSVSEYALSTKVCRLDPTSGQWIVLGYAEQLVGGVGVKQIACTGGSLYLAGTFVDIRGGGRTQTAKGVARWTGAKWRALSKELDGAVNAIVVRQESIWLGGNFNAIAGQEVNHVAKWNGSAWQSVGGGTNGEVTSLVVEGNDAYVGGYFSEAGGQPVANVARWNGTAWTALGSGSRGRVKALVVDGGDVYAAGRFQSSTQLVDDVARWRSGGDWEVLGGTVGTVHALAIFNGHVVVGSDTGGGIRRWNGAAWELLGGGCNAWVVSLLAEDNDLYVGGTFTQAGTVSARGIARWDGSAWHPLGEGITPGVVELAGHSGDIYAATSFPHEICKWNGTTWSAIGTRLNYMPYYAINLDGARSMAFTPSGNLLIGGFFFEAGPTWSPFLVQANLPGSTLNAQETWRQTHFGSYANSGSAADTADFDGDGLANLVEYAFGLNPTQGGSAALPQPQSSGGNCSVSFQHPAGMTGVTYGAEWSATLAPDSWQPVTDTGVAPQHVFSVPIGTNTKMFIRLKVTVP
ncbi:MAG: hypothetical protein ACO1TE_26810 [Prosthecobacter sp.]